MAKELPADVRGTCGTEMVDVFSLTLDPNNVNQHGERSIDSLKLSLLTYGQQDEILARKADRVVVAHNGTLKAMQLLASEGRDEFKTCRVTWTNLTGDAAKAYGIANNKIASLSEFSYPDLADQLRQLEASSPELMPTIGFADFELDPLLKSDWTPPAEDGSSDEPATDGETATPKGKNFKANAAQAAIINQAIEMVRSKANTPDMADGQALDAICRSYIAEQPK